MMNNNEQKSILEVFGSKSQDGDKVKGLLLNALTRNSYENGGEVIKPREIRRSARIDPYLRDIKGGKEGEPYYLNPYDSDRDAYDILDSITFLMKGAEHPYQGSFRGESPAPGGNIGYPSKAQMQPMGKGEAIMSKLASLLGRGK